MFRHLKPRHARGFLCLSVHRSPRRSCGAGRPERMSAGGKKSVREGPSNIGRLHVRRSKKGTPSVHPMQGDEIRALRRLQREQEASPYVFTSERGGPMSAKSFGTLFERLGKRAGMPFTIFPHMLRHACGYALANAGHDTRALQAWLGHKNIQHTVRYTELAPDRFKNFWRD